MSSLNKSGYADDIIKELCNEHLGSGADLDRQIPYWEEDADKSQGPAIETGEIAWTNLLDTIQMICEISVSAGEPILFDVELAEVPESAGLARISTFYGIRGADKTKANDALIFGLEFGNLAEPRMEYNAERETNTHYAVSYGQAGAMGDTLGVTRLNSVWNVIEDAIRAYNGPGMASISWIGAYLAGKNRAKYAFSGKLVDTPGCKYGIHWDFGDQVLVQYQGQSFTSRIKQLTVEVTEHGKETLEATFEID